MSEAVVANHIVFVVHYFPPINSSGAKRVEAISKYLVRAGRKVTVITTRKSGADGAFTEAFPDGVDVLELDWRGRAGQSMEGSSTFEPMYIGKPGLKRRIKDAVMRALGQLPDPRLPFALSFLRPGLDDSVRKALSTADVVVGSCPPWPTLLAALAVRWRFGTPCVLDYRDHFSECHEMPGSRFAKWLEKVVDRYLARSANGLVTISDPMGRYYSDFRDDVAVIMNGYDHEAMESARASLPPMDMSGGKPIVVRYLGIVSPGRVPHNLLKALQNLVARGWSEASRLRFEYYGNAAVMAETLRRDYPSLLPLFSFHDAVPYRNSLALMATADALLFSETSNKSTLSAQGILTTKLFEYLGSGRPVLADIAPDTLAGEVIAKAGSHHFVSESVEAFEAHLQGVQFLVPRQSEDSPFVKTLSRAYQAQQYQTLLDTVSQTR